MVQDMKQSYDMLLVTFYKLGLSNIVDDHVPNLLAAALLGQEVLRHGCCSYFWDVFMFSDGEHLFFGQAAQPDAVFKRDHSCLQAVHFPIKNDSEHNGRYGMMYRQSV
jgi:hypothetical protein